MAIARNLPLNFAATPIQRASSGRITAAKRL